MTRKRRNFTPEFKSKVASKIPKDLVNRVDKICSQKLQSCGGWIRQTIVEKVRELEGSPVFEKI